MVDVYSGGVIVTIAAIPIDGLTIEVLNKAKGTTTGEIWSLMDVTHPSPTWITGEGYQVKGKLINRAAGPGAYVEKANQKVILAVTIGAQNLYMEDTLTNADGYYEFNRTVNPADNWEGKTLKFWVYTAI